MTGPGGYAPGRDQDAAHASRAAPTAECIYWRPLTGEPTGPGAAEYPIYIRQRALAALHDHFRGASQQGILGFLVGAMLEDPTTRHRWLEVEFIVRLTQAIYGDKTTLVISRVWERLQQEVTRTGGRMLGWYHSHPPLGIEIAPGDIEAHEQYFGRPWQVALVLAQGLDGPAGAFYRPSAGLPLGTTPLAFYEIVARDSITPEGRRRTRVAWRNYKPDLKRTSGAMTGVSAVLQALQVPAKPPPAPPPPAAPAPRRRITPPRGSAAIRLPEPSEAAPRATVPARRSGVTDARPDAELHVPPTLLRSAMASPPASTPDAAAPAAVPAPDRPARAAPPPRPPPPPATVHFAPAAAEEGSARGSAATSPPAREPPETPPGDAAETPELAARASGPQPMPETGEGAGVPRLVRPRARPTQEVLKDLATAISGPHRRPTVPGSEAGAPGGSEASRVTFTPSSVPASVSPEPEPEEPPDEAMPAEPPALTFTPGERRSGEHPPVPVTAPEPLPAGLRDPVWISSTQPDDTAAPTAPLRPSVDVLLPRPSSHRTFAAPLSRVTPSGPLWFVAVVVVGLAAGAWWLLLGSQRLAVPVGVQPTAASSVSPAAAVDSSPDTVQVAQAQPTPDPAVATAPPAAPAVSGPGGALGLFDAVFDSLTSAIVAYQERALRFDEGDRDCTALSSSLITVDRLWIAYNARRRGVTLDSLRRELDQGVYSNVESVDGHFRQSGCPRP